MASAIDPATRYARNMPALTPDDQRMFATKRVCVCGCGGLGGYVIEYLARLGIGTIVAIDGDAFEATNLNRQLLAREDNLGQSKAIAARERVRSINSSVTVIAHDAPISTENAAALLANCDIAVDALDSRETRFMLENWCAEAQLPLVHAAVSGWYAQVTTIAPGSHALSRIYPACEDEPVRKPSVLSFVPALAAAHEAGECVKVLLGKSDVLYGKLLVIDLLHNAQRIIEL